MGYYSTYELEISNNKEDKIISCLRTWSEDAEYALNENGECNQSAKWYDSDEELKEFSKKYPSLIFSLKRAGEENGDICITHFKNGKMQECFAEITFDPFDESKLK